MPRLKLLLLSLSILASFTAKADDDVKFVALICNGQMSAQTKVPKDEIGRFCNCASEEVRKNITTSQRESIREAVSMLRANKPPPEDIFEKTGLNQLMSRSQEYCTDLLYPVEPTHSEQNHSKFSEDANRSVDEFDGLLVSSCGHLQKGMQLNTCLHDASQEWLNTHGEKYRDIHKHCKYCITGNDLAETMIEKIQ